MCVQVCPKDVKPMDQILRLRAAATHEGIRNNNGSRHTLAFVDLVGANGRLDEFRLPVFTEGKFNFVGQLSYLPSAPRMIKSGKMPPLFPHKISGVKHVKRILKSFDEKQVLPPRVRAGGHGGH
jgi:succinate dehydrogenase / fumarate reductase iron-sulfur subunit